jgi:murein DD-endopeptidase MepM/ murein hydrolase activator NlpD
MFGFGIAVPLVTVSLLLTGEPGESNPAPLVANPAAATAIAETRLNAVVPATETAQDEPPVATDESAPPAPSTVADLAEEAPAFDTLELIVARNDTLDALFRRNGLSIRDLAGMLDIPVAAEPLRRLRPGDRLSVVHRGPEILRLERELGDDAILTITREPSGFTATEIPRDIEIRVVGRHGVVRSSLFEAGMAAEIPDAVIMRMAGIFQWDIDFILDVRANDHFTLLYQERWREGERIGTGAILAAEYVNRGRSYRVVRFVDPSGHADYYTEDGRSVRKAFVRAPVEFTRISSSFNPNRRHPVLNTIRAHRGVDYAAPSGTPVIAAGGGKIIRRSAYGSFGNTVIVQHGGNITTLYAHLSRFAGPRLGARVDQGEVIGYVGQTGLASGPHLHYEYRINGVHRNPRTVELPPADPVNPEYRAQFTDVATALRQQLDAFRSAFVAATR